MSVQLKAIAIKLNSDQRNLYNALSKLSENYKRLDGKNIGDEPRLERAIMRNYNSIGLWAKRMSKEQFETVVWEFGMPELEYENMIE